VLGQGFTVAVLSGGPAFGSAHLPGRLVLIDARLLERLDSAEALAGYLLVEEQALLAHDPMRDVLAHAGTGATFRLLTTGALPESRARRPCRPAPSPRQPRARSPAPRSRGSRRSAYRPPPSPCRCPPDQRARSPAPWPTRPGPASAAPLLSDGEWLTLTQICQATAR
jgi:hypothetical protein